MILAPEGSFHGPAAWEVLLLTLQIKTSPFRNIEQLSWIYLGMLQQLYPPDALCQKSLQEAESHKT